MGETTRAARAAKAASRASTPSKYWVGSVDEVIDATHCKVVSGEKKFTCVVPASLLVNVGASVQIRVRGNDYLVNAVLDGENQPKDILEQIAALTPPVDTTPPNTPSLPVLASEVSTINVTWDGLDYASAAMPSDFHHVDILADASNPPTTQVNRMWGASTIPVYGEAHTTVWVSLVAYDTTGNASAATTPVSVVVKSVLDDTGLDEALATRPRFYTPENGPGSETPPEASWWLKADGTLWRFISGTWTAQTFDASDTISAGTIVASLIAAAAVTADKIAANAVTADKIFAGAVTAAKIATGAIEADKIKAGAIDGFVITGATVRTAASGARVELNSTGLHGYNSSGVEKTKVGTDGTLTADSANLTNANLTGALTASAVDGTYIATVSGGFVTVSSNLGSPKATLTPTGLLLGIPEVYSGRLYYDGDGVHLAAYGGKPVRLSGYPEAFVGELNADVSLTASNYKSLKPSTQVASHGGLAPSFTGDCAVIPTTGWWRIVAAVMFSNDSTSGNRVIQLLKNFTSTTYNSSTIPASSYRLAEFKTAASSDTTSALIVWEGPLAAADKIMLTARSSTAVGVLSGAHQTSLTMTLVGE